MKTIFLTSFERDLKKLKKNRQLRSRIQQAIEKVENAKELQELPKLKKLSGSGDYGRIRIGDYRIGVAFKTRTVVFVRCLHRRDIYCYFP